MAAFNPLNKPKEEEKGDPEQQKIKKNSCGRCKARGLTFCTGHIEAGSGSGGGGGGEIKGSAPTGAILANKKSTPEEEVIGDQWLEEGDELSSEGDPIESQVFDLDLIKELFSIYNESEKGILKISLKPGKLLNEDEEEEVKDYLHAIKMEFAQFKGDLKKQGISVDDFTDIPSANELIIRIPLHKYYDDFIRQLVSNYLLSKEYSHLKDLQVGKSSTLTPFATRPSVNNRKRDDLDKEEGDVNNDLQDDSLNEQQERKFNPSPFDFNLIS